MSKINKRDHARKFTKIIILLVRYWLIALKLTFAFLRRLFNLVFKGISKRLRFSITFKTASMYTVIFSGIILSFSAVMITSFGVYLLNDAKSSLERNAQLASDMVREPLVTTATGEKSVTIPVAKLKRYAEIEGIQIRILNRQKQLLYSSSESNLSVTALDNPARVFITGGEFMHLKIHNLVDDQLYYLILTKSIAVSIKQLLLLVAATGIGFLIAVFLTVIVGSSSLKKMLKPIDNMISTARSVSAKDLKTRLNVVDSHDELKELAETFNEMLDRIQLSYEQQNQFVSDASHELRTPISVVQGYASLLQRWGKEDREVLDEAVNAIKNESENMKQLVEKLLFLARTDRDTQQLEKSTFSLNELIEEVVKETKLIDTEHQISSDTSANQAPVTLIADRRLLKQAVRIFVDNSIKHTLPGGTIKINGYLSDNRIKLTVEDNGIGIAKEDLPLIFNRFYKCDKARTREAGGTGLGLSIAKWIIEKHQGQVRVESTLNKGTLIIVSLPTS